MPPRTQAAACARKVPCRRGGRESHFRKRALRIQKVKRRPRGAPLFAPLQLMGGYLDFGA